LTIQGERGGNNPAIKRHFELQIMTLQNAPRDADKLKALLRAKKENRSSRSYDSK
jgi:hypothetical protein